MNYSEKWTDEYKGVRYEVVHWRLGWNYYLYIPLAQLPDDIQPKFNLKARSYRMSPDSERHFAYDPYKAQSIRDLDWHGGVTFYEKHRNEFGKVDGVKIGCDFMHFFDEGIAYSLESVSAEARASINKLWALVPNLKYRCSWDGNYYPESEGTLNEHGNFIANINKAKNDEARLKVQV